MQIRNAAVALLAVTAAVGLTACGGDDDEDEGDAGTSASGPVVGGSGYEYALPEGWTDVGALGADAPRAFQDELALVDSLATVDLEGEFASAINVATAAAPEGTTLDGFARASLESIANPATFPAGVEFTSPPEGPTETELGGEPAMELAHNGTFRGKGISGNYEQRQLLALRDGAAYVATLASYVAAEGDSEDDAAAFEQIISSWQWE